MEIKRAAELTVVAILKEAFTSLAFYPSKGDLVTPSPIPPFGVVIIDRAEKSLHQEDTSVLSGKVSWITRADTTDSVTHDTTVKSIYDVMVDFTSGYDPVTKLIVHGLDVMASEEENDEARQAHRDIVMFVMGVTQKG